MGESEHLVGSGAAFYNCSVWKKSVGVINCEAPPNDRIINPRYVPPDGNDHIHLTHTHLYLHETWKKCRLFFSISCANVSNSSPPFWFFLFGDHHQIQALICEGAPRRATFRSTPLKINRTCGSRGAEIISSHAVILVGWCAKIQSQHLLLLLLAGAVQLNKYLRGWGIVNLLPPLGLSMDHIYPRLPLRKIYDFSGCSGPVKDMKRVRVRLHIGCWVIILFLEQQIWGDKFNGFVDGRMPRGRNRTQPQTKAHSIIVSLAISSPEGYFMGWNTPSSGIVILL